MRATLHLTAIAISGVVLLAAAPAPANAAPPRIQTAATIELSADSAPAKKPVKKMKKQKVEYMKSAAPPEPKK